MKNYKGIILTATAAMVSNALLRNRIRYKVENLKKSKSERFSEKSVDILSASDYSMKSSKEYVKKVSRQHIC